MTDDPRAARLMQDLARLADIGVDPATGMLTIALDAGTSVVKYALSVADTVTVASLDSLVQLRRADGTVLPIGRASVQLAGVTLDTPETVSTPTFIVTGTAPPNETVTVYADGKAAGTASAGEGGRYRAAVEFADPIDKCSRTIEAVTVLDGVTLRSDIHVVRYDSDFIEATKATVENRDGSAEGTRAISFDPREGVASFTQV